MAEITTPTRPADRIKLNVGGKLFETTTSTLRSAGPDSLLTALSNRPAQDPVFIDRDPDIFAVLLSVLRSRRLPSTARRFSKSELSDEASYYGLESHLKTASLPCKLAGIDCKLSTNVVPASDGVVTDFAVSDDDGSVWIGHGGQVSVYDWNLNHSGTIRTHLECVAAISRVSSEVAAVSGDGSGGLHFYNFANGRRVGSVEWTDPSDPRIYKARVTAVESSVGSVFASYECYHKENCVLEVDRERFEVKAEFGRQNGNSSKSMVPGKLRFVPEIGVLVGSAVLSGAFGYSGYVRMWDPRSGNVVWETNEPGSGRSSRFGDSFADVDVDVEKLSICKICSQSGDLAMADMRKLGDDPWVYLKDKNPGMKSATGANVHRIVHCYRKQVFVGRDGELEVWSSVEEGGNSLCEDSYRRNYMDKVEDSERGIVRKIKGGWDRLFVSREGVEGLEVWESSDFSGWFPFCDTTRSF